MGVSPTQLRKGDPVNNKTEYYPLLQKLEDHLEELKAVKDRIILRADYDLSSINKLINENREILNLIENTEKIMLLSHLRDWF